MKSRYILYILLLSTVTSFGQSDTIVLNYSDKSNPFIFGRTNWKTPKNILLRETINPNYDTIFWKTDSSLFTGYLKMLHIEMHSGDTMHFGTTRYKVKKGIPSFINSYTLNYRDEDYNHTPAWKIRCSYLTDSSKIDESFHSNGLLKSSHQYIFDDSVSFSYYYNAAGQVEYSVRQKNHEFDGPRYMRLNNCCGLTIIYESGIIRAFKAENLIYFNRHQRIITGDKFIAALTNNTEQNWGYQILNDNASNPSGKTIMLYLTKRETELHYSIEGRAIQSGRKTHLLKKGSKKN